VNFKETQVKLSTLQHLGKNNFRSLDFKTRRKIAKRQRDEESKSKIKRTKIKIESRFQINEPREYSDQNKNTSPTSAAAVHQEENDNDKSFVSNSDFAYDIDPEKRRDTSHLWRVPWRRIVRSWMGHGRCSLSFFVSET
jgi:hypothetical protein